MTAFALGLVLIVALVGPILFKWIERNLELFFLGVGILSALISHQVNWRLCHAALNEPIALAVTVLIFGAMARLFRARLDALLGKLAAILSVHWICFLLIIILGLTSSVITAVIAALILVEALALLRLDRRGEVRVVVLACFAIGLGAALTPVGEPLGTIAIAALHADFLYLIRLLGLPVIAGITIVAALVLIEPVRRTAFSGVTREAERWSAICARALRVYVFVAGLIGLSWGMRPLIESDVSKLPASLLFWLNSVSAIVDNATLTAVEIAPVLNAHQQRAILMGLLISGGMLIPGNIPNIVAAGRMGITSREWASVGLPIGLPMMFLCFLAMLWIY